MSLPHGRKIFHLVRDQTRWLRLLWQTPLPPTHCYDIDEWVRQHDDLSNTVRGSMLTLTGYCFFCFLTLAAPDRELLAAGAKIKVPFAGVEVSYVAFLTIGPLVLAILASYLHLFVWHLRLLDVARPQGPIKLALPYLFNLGRHSSERRSIAAAVGTSFAFYWLPWATAATFAWKALPRPEAPALFAFATLFGLALVLVVLRRPAPSVSRTLRGLLLVFASILILVGVNRVFDMSQGLNRWLSRSLNLAGADLSGQDLRSTDLTAADLTGANLKQARLENANLTFVTARGANLTDAVLARADLHGADFAGADFSGADLSNANISLARFRAEDSGTSDARVSADQISVACIVKYPHIPELAASLPYGIPQPGRLCSRNPR